MQSLMSLINQLLEKVLITLMAAIVVVVTWQVFSRFILQSPSSYTEELARFLLIWIGVLGAAYAYKNKAHLGLDILVERIPEQSKWPVLVLIELLVIVFAASILVYGGSLLVWMTLDLNQISASLEIKVGLVYSVLPLSGVLILMYCVTNISKILAEKGAA
ncbi:TRAP transporter small permease [Shewanella sp. UCD-KL21]|uniref:TRAP transporter small permease n=1 Tax=Shewanella sp. UCD-KL21 TaxID=1917164 RepID=UPI0009711950|nr:TRAP transporter small permease [Shewanella sp. UCD-KL21]